MSRIRTVRPPAPMITRFAIEVPLVARGWQPGQFVIVRVADSSSAQQEGI